MIQLDPRYMDAKHWFDQRTQDLTLAGYSGIPILKDADHWIDWARTVIQLPKIAALSPPLPDHFQNWQDWAQRFNQVLP